MKNNLFEILHLLMEHNTEGFFTSYKEGVCSILYRGDGNGQMCTSAGVSCLNCPFLYSLKKSILFKIVGDY